MSTVSLYELEGYRPLGIVGGVDKYLLEKGGEYLAAVALLGGGYPATSEEVENAARIERREYRRWHGFAPFVGRLTSQLQEAAERRQASTGYLARTALTDLFAERYGVAMEELTERRPDALRMWGRVNPPTLTTGFSMDYLHPRGPHGDVFWQLEANADYGFVNLRCFSTPTATPLSGYGNIAFMPGVEEALSADVQMLADAARQS